MLPIVYIAFNLISILSGMSNSVHLRFTIRKYILNSAPLLLNLLPDKRLKNFKELKTKRKINLHLKSNFTIFNVCKYQFKKESHTLLRPEGRLSLTNCRMIGEILILIVDQCLSEAHFQSSLFTSFCFVYLQVEVLNFF